MTVCKRVHYSGRVQGVGFRYTALGLSRGHAVTGYVRNLDDGRVELLAEGQDSEVDAFLASLDATMARYIDDRQVNTVEPLGRSDFRIER